MQSDLALTRLYTMSVEQCKIFILIILTVTKLIDGKVYLSNSAG
jgi:hypothetical protein